MMSYATQHGFLLAVIRAILDLFCLILAYLFVIMIDPYFDGGKREAFWLYWPYLVTYAVVWCGAAADQRLFVSRRSEALVTLLFSMARAFFTTFLFTAFLLAIFLQDGIDRLFFLFYSLIALTALLSFRLTIGISLSKLRRLGFNAQRIIVIGANERTANLVQIFLANEHFGYHIEGFLESDPERRSILERYGISWLGPIDNLEEILLKHVTDGVYVSLPVRSHYETIQSIAHLCEGIGVPVRFIADIFPLRLATSDFTRLHDIPLLSLTYEPEFQTRFALRKASDLIAAVVLLLFLLPLMLSLAIAIKLESTGPVFCRRKNFLPNGGEFNLLSYRVTKEDIASDASNVEFVGNDIRHDDVNVKSEEARTKYELTHVGRWIRRNGLEELPQLFNVIQGNIILSGMDQRLGTPVQRRARADNSTDSKQAPMTS